MNIFTDRHREGSYFEQPSGIDGSLKNLINMAAAVRARIKRLDHWEGLAVAGTKRS